MCLWRYLLNHISYEAFTHFLSLVELGIPNRAYRKKTGEVDSHSEKKMLKLYAQILNVYVQAVLRISNLLIELPPAALIFCRSDSKIGPEVAYPPLPKS